MSIVEDLASRIPVSDDQALRSLAKTPYPVRESLIGIYQARRAAGATPAGAWAHVLMALRGGRSE